MNLDGGVCDDDLCRVIGSNTQCLRCWPALLCIQLHFFVHACLAAISCHSVASTHFGAIATTSHRIALWLLVPCNRPDHNL